eukprot:2906825-Rhodomonas_salina.7
MSVLTEATSTILARAYPMSGTDIGPHMCFSSQCKAYSHSCAHGQPAGLSISPSMPRKTKGEET